jgi:putative salt-induced outer membrane protein YdiY
MTKSGGLLLALAALSIAKPATAQVNIERLRRAQADSGFTGTLGANLTARTGNVSLVLLNVDGRLDYGRPGWLAFLVGNADIGWQGGQRFSNSGLLHLRGNRLLSSVVAGELFTQVDYDRSRLLSFRAIVGGGARLDLARSVRWRLSTGTGLMFEHERLELPPTASHPDETNAVRWTNYVTGNFRDAERLSIAGTLYAQPRVDGFGDVRLLSDLRLAVQLVGALSLTVTSRIRYDSRPPDGIESLDTALTTGLALEW